MNITRTDFGKTSDGEAVELFTLANDNGLVAKVTSFGAILTEMHVPDRSGKLADVALGFGALDGYLAKHPYFGATVGRVANRTSRGRFTLDGREYTLATNNGGNHLHGGNVGFDKAVWKAEEVQTPDAPALKLTHLSPDGDEGYPGDLSVAAVYSLNNDGELKIEMTATTNKPTPVNLVNHSYWNLAGQDAGDILSHEMMINADSYTPVDDKLIPTGDVAPVAGTPLDFRKPNAIGARIDQTTGGYDHNFVLNGEIGRMKLAAKAYESESGRVMEVHTTEPGVQFYSGNFLDGSITGKDGAVYNKHAGFCLETQHFPDSANRPEFPSIILRPGQTYRHEMVHKFYTA